MVEYNLGLAVALVEYKHFKAQIPNLSHPTYRALSDLANNYSGTPGGLPFFLAFYWPDVWAFRVFPVNDRAISVFGKMVELSEREYVSALYALRSLKIEERVFKELSNTRPPMLDEIADENGF